MKSLSKRAWWAIPAFFCVGIAATAAPIAKPLWAFYDDVSKYPAPAAADGEPQAVPGSQAHYARSDFLALSKFTVPDWLPDQHPAMPDVVAHGNPQERVFPCALCHLPTGTGHPESSALAGLSANYVAQQMADFKDGTRGGSAIMTMISKGISDQEVSQSASYFAQLKDRHAPIKVIKSATVPDTMIGPAGMRIRVVGGGMRPLGTQVVEIPADEAAALDHDPRAAYLAYVPEGAIQRGEVLVTQGGNGKTVSCGGCHGDTLEGAGSIPAIRGRSTQYVVRQLFLFQAGLRTDDKAKAMQPVVEKLTEEDMVDISAYLASLESN